MNVVFTVLLVLAAIYLVHRHISSNRRLNAAMNVVLAKYTFERLSAPQRSQVELRAQEILLKCGFQGYEFNGDIEKFGFYAIAMHELDIDHGMEGYPGWNIVQNPFLAVLPNDPAFKVAVYAVKQRTGSDISVDHAHILFDRIAAATKAPVLDESAKFVSTPETRTRKFSIEEFEKQMAVDKHTKSLPLIPDWFIEKYWESLKGRIAAGDELWFYTSSQEMWDCHAGSCGFALLSKGKVIWEAETLMN